MRTSHLSNLSVQQQENTRTFEILDHLSAEIAVRENPYFIPLENLFSMAARKNKKRAFLFVSKLLGKHIPVRPELALLTGKALAARYLETVHGKAHPELEAIIRGLHGDAVSFSSSPEQFKLPEETVFIGFAETATALGHAVFENFSNAVFFHTTREQIDGMESIIHFEEEHSHATSHRCYVKKELLDGGQPVVLVDDEVTTGNTALNIIESIQLSFPRKEYTVISILDWRSDADREKFRETEQRLGIKIHHVSLLEGTIKLVGTPAEEFPEAPVQSEESEAEVTVHELPFFADEEIRSRFGYLLYTGRFGLKSEDQRVLDEKAKEAGTALKELRTGSRTLCLGTGEFMYLPMKAAVFMGEGAVYQSSTRSPIHPAALPDYAVQTAYPYISPEDGETLNYFYNASQGQYDEVFVFFEKKMSSEALKPMLDQLKRVFPIVRIILFSGQSI